MLRSLIFPLIAVSFTFVNPCDQPAKVRQPGADDKIYEVKVIYPQFTSVPQAYSVDGKFDVSEVDIITANASGEIEQLYVNEGDTVEQDDPVVSISNSNLVDRIDLKRAKIKEYKARLEEIQIKLEVSAGVDQPVNLEDSTFLDEEPLDEPVKKDFGNASAPKPKPRTIKAMAEVLEATIEAWTKEADILDRKLLDLTLNTPVSGVVTKKFVSEGNRVKVQDKLLEISKTDPMSVTFLLPNEIASFVDKHSKVKVYPTDNPDAKGQGNVYFINPNIDTNTGKIEVRAHVVNTNGLIKGGQNAKVQLNTRKMSRVIVLPKTVLYYENGKKFVFIAYRNQAKLVEVTTGDEDDNGQVQIFGELRVDDPIVMDRPMELRHNSFIKVTKKDAVE